jgi:hypothetical protein
MNENITKSALKMSFKEKNELIKKLQGECPVCYENVANFEPKCLHRICDECAKNIKQCVICKEPFDKINHCLTSIHYSQHDSNIYSDDNSDEDEIDIAAWHLANEIRCRAAGSGHLEILKWLRENMNWYKK